MSPDPIRAALRAAAAAHQPDRTAILARIDRGRAAAGPAWTSRTGHRRTAVRTVAMAVAATMAAALGFSMAVTWAAEGTDALHGPSHAPMVASAPAGGGPATAPGPAVTSRAPAASRSPRPPAASPSTRRDQQGFLRSNGAIDAQSIDNWTQSNVTVATGEALTALEVTVRIAATPYLANTGAWSTVLAEDLVTTVEQQPDALVYRFTLRPGARLGPGSYVFAVQYNHAVGGRDPSRDTYRAVAAAGGTRAEVDGGF